jgi:hypothetical protein
MWFANLNSKQDRTTDVIPLTRVAQFRSKQEPRLQHWSFYRKTGNIEIISSHGFFCTRYFIEICLQKLAATLKGFITF